MIGDYLIKQYLEYKSPHSLFGIIGSSIQISEFFFEDNSFTGWTDVGSGIGGSAGKLSSVYTRSATNNASSVDMGATLSDTEWVLRCEYDITVFAGADADGNLGFFGISDSPSSTSSESSHDGLCISLTRELGFNKFRVSAADASSWFGLTENMDLTATVTTFYLEMKRISSTSFTVNLYSDSGFSTLVESQNLAINSTTISLRYPISQNFANATASTNTITVLIDDLQVKDGTSTF